VKGGEQVKDGGDPGWPPVAAVDIHTSVVGEVLANPREIDPDLDPM
jgi:hypothetical protein